MKDERSPSVSNYIAMLQTTLDMAGRSCAQARQLATQEDGYLLGRDLQGIESDLSRLENRVLEIRRAYAQWRYESQAPDRTEGVTASAYAGRQVIVIDDEPSILQFLRDLLEVEGFSVVPLVRADDANSVTQGSSPAFFLIDLMLPGTCGIELAQSLRSSGFATTPMIAMSASKFMIDSAAKTQLFDAVIRKPFDTADLVSLVKRYAA